MSEWQRPPDGPQYPEGQPPAPPPAYSQQPATSHAAAKTSSPTPWIIALVAALLVGGGAGFLIGHSTRSHASPKSTATGTGHISGSASGLAGQISVDGTITLTDSDGWIDTVDTGDDSLPSLSDGDTCAGTGGYDDIDEGAQVIISSDTGKTLQIVGLNEGHIKDGDCQFEFLAVVPKGFGFYGVEVTHRGVVKEPEAALSSVALTLG